MPLIKGISVYVMEVTLPLTNWIARQIEAYVSTECDLGCALALTSIDVTAASDLSEDAEKQMGTHLLLGKGPCLLHMDESFIPNADLVEAIRKIADKHNIPIQHEVSSFGTTDASNISTVRRGVPSATISIPIRNVHSVVEIANRKDVESTI